MTLIDLHCHILPGVDDGAGSLEEALEMARRAVADGIGVMAATPHLPIPGGALPTAVETGRAVGRLQAHLDQAAIPLRLVCGAEVHLTPAAVRRAVAGELTTLNESRYLLVDFPAMSPPAGLLQALRKLRRAGLVPVIAHPERYLWIQADGTRLEAMVAMGCLAQVTAMSITGHFGYGAMRCAHELLARRLVHVVASDGHNPTGRPPKLGPALSWVAPILDDPEEAEAMFVHRPAAIIEDRSLEELEVQAVG